MQARAWILEAHHTTHIEGTHFSLEQSERLMAGENLPGIDAEEIKELLNYRKAFDFALGYVFSQGPMTEGLLREVHRRLLEGVRGNAGQPGEYRTTLEPSKTKEITSTPPAASELSALMAELVDWLQNERTIPPILMAGIAQFQLMHIRPFLEGNGRVARLLSLLCLYRFGYDFKQLGTISKYYNRNRQEYYRALQSVRDQDMTSWLEYFAKGLEIEMHEIELKGSHALKLEALVLHHKLSERQKQPLESLWMREGAFTIQEYESLCPGMNRRSLQRDLSVLIEKGLIFREGIKKGVRYKINRSF
jgi:Fic family protein